MMEEQMFKAVGASFGQNDYGMWSFVEEVMKENINEKGSEDCKMSAIWFIMIDLQKLRRRVI